MATPIYDALRDELLTDPEAVARELDEQIIRWHTARQRGRG